MVDGHLSAAFAELTSEDGERHPPFRWQARLLQRLLDADPPRVAGAPVRWSPSQYELTAH